MLPILLFAFPLSAFAKQPILFSAMGEKTKNGSSVPDFNEEYHFAHIDVLRVAHSVNRNGALVVHDADVRDATLDFIAKYPKSIAYLDIEEACYTLKQCHGAKGLRDFNIGVLGRVVDVVHETAPQLRVGYYAF